MAHYKIDIEAENLKVQARYDLCRLYMENRAPSGSAVSSVVCGIIRDALSSGYKVWRGTGWREANPVMLAKVMRSGEGDKLYQIVLELWDLKLEISGHDHGVTLSPSCQFYIGERRGNGRTVDVKCFTTEADSLAAIEGFYASFYGLMGCVPYEKADEG